MSLFENCMFNHVSGTLGKYFQYEYLRSDGEWLVDGIPARSRHHIFLAPRLAACNRERLLGCALLL
jgi:hypothetical protein